MNRFIRELRRREVFRTAGLYVGVSWIAIEVASVMLPAFDAPDWVLRALIIVAIIGFPVSLVLAWIYDVTDDGVAVQADATDTVVIPFGGRRMDFVVIGVLSVALILSVYMNITGGPEVVEELEPVSVLIADFDNQTGDPLFDGSLEQALQIGIEGASFVTGYQRGVAQKVAAQFIEIDALDAETAQLVAAREGVKIVLAGSIAADDEEYELKVSAITPSTGETIAVFEKTSANKLEVLATISELAADLREELGDKSLDRDALEVSETFTAMSLEAAREYGVAQQLQHAAKYEQAIKHYRAAVEHDPNFGRAYSGWAVAARSLGRTDEATEAWEKAMANLGSMTERERLRTQGIYYWGVTRNYQKAIETYETLIEKYPADFVGSNNLALVKFSALDFDGARAEGRHAVQIYPGNAIARSNYALYAMYSSDFATAVSEAEKVRELDPTWFAAWLPIAMNALSSGDLETARSAYQSMSETGKRGASTASLGLADLEFFTGDFDSARNILTQAISADQAMNNKYGEAVKHMALADVLLELGEVEAAAELAERGLETVRAPATLVPAALVHISAGDQDAALHIAASLAEQLSPQSRAYAEMITALVFLESGDHLAAINQLTAAIDTADLWLLRLHRGRAYLEGGYYVEALDDFTVAQDRHGEATAVFLDDLPTYRYMSALPYWMARAQQGLGMSHEARQNFSQFVSRRPAGGAMADDARHRMK